MVGVFWYRRPFVCYGGIESELSRFINASCVRITFQLGQCCQDHIFVYVDNYKRCYLITFCYSYEMGENGFNVLSYLCASDTFSAFFLQKKKKKKKNGRERGMPCRMAERQPHG